MNPVKILRGQVYHEVDRVPYVRKDGCVTEIVIWRSACAECGAPFEVRTPARFPDYMNRRCKVHRKSGVPVNRRAKA